MAGQTITAVIAADARPFKKGMTDSAKSTSLLTKSLKNVSLVGVAAFAALTAASISFLGSSLKAADESRQISKGLERAVKNSKAFGSSATNISKVTDALGAASSKLGELTGIDDEVIAGLKRNWLSVPRIAATGIKGINKLAVVAADVAAGTGKDLEAVASAFTKAYGDPKGAIAKLQKAGVILSDQEKARYAQLIKNNKETQALAYLADTVGRKFAGAGVAAASPFQRLQVIFGNFQEDIGTLFLPLIDSILPDLQKAFGDLKTDPEFMKALDEFAKTIKDILPDLMDSLPALVDMLKIMAGALQQTAKAITDVKNAFNFGDTTKSGPVWENLYKNTNPFALGIAKSVSPARSSTNVNINVNSVSPSAETGRAITAALQSYYRTGGRQVA